MPSSVQGYIKFELKCILSSKISKRKSFGEKAHQTEDTQDTIDNFFYLAKKICFPISEEITTDLLFKY